MNMVRVFYFVGLDIIVVEYNLGRSLVFVSCARVESAGMVFRFFFWVRIEKVNRYYVTRSYRGRVFGRIS